MVTNPALLSEIALFDGLTPAQLSRLNQLFRRKTFAAGTHIFSMDQPAEAVYVIVGGTIKICLENPDGTDVILSIVGPGEVLGEVSVVDGLGHSASAVTLEVSTLLWLDRAAFRNCMDTMPAIARNLTHILACRLRCATRQVQSLASQDVYGRVARQLLDFARQYDTGANPDVLIPIRLTQSDLADLVGASRERVNKVLATYKKSKCISVDRNHHFTIHDLAALAKRCR